MDHKVITALVAGIGPVLKDELDKLRRENETLRAMNATLQAKMEMEITLLKGDLAAYRRELTQALENGLPVDQLPRATQRRLSS